MGAKRTSKKATAKRPASPKKAATGKAASGKAATGKAATRKTAAGKTTAARRSTRQSAKPPLTPTKRAPTRALAPEELAARIAATGLVSSAYVLPWEPIHSPADYAPIVARLCDLAEGDLPVERVESSVDLEGGEGSLEIVIDGVRHFVDVAVQGADLDEGVLVVLDALLERRQGARPPAERRRFFVDPSTCRKAHTHLLVCATDDAAAALNAATGAAFLRATEL